MKKISRNKQRKHIHNRLRFHLKGTAEVPRLNVFKSLKYIYCQIINDENGKVLVTSSSLNLKDLKNKSNVEAAIAVGTDIAKKAQDIKIKKVVFDRGGYIYHGKIKAIADAARKNGLEF